MFGSVWHTWLEPVDNYRQSWWKSEVTGQECLHLAGSRWRQEESMRCSSCQSSSLLCYCISNYNLPSSSKCRWRWQENMTNEVLFYTQLSDLSISYFLVMISTPQSNNNYKTNQLQLVSFFTKFILRLCSLVHRVLQKDVSLPLDTLFNATSTHRSSCRDNLLRPLLFSVFLLCGNSSLSCQFSNFLRNKPCFRGRGHDQSKRFGQHQTSHNGFKGPTNTTFLNLQRFETQVLIWSWGRPVPNTAINRCVMQSILNICALKHPSIHPSSTA